MEGEGNEESTATDFLMNSAQQRLKRALKEGTAQCLSEDVSEYLISTILFFVIVLCSFR